MPGKINIAKGGESTFAIVIPENAPVSIQEAAKELQQCINISTGAMLSICCDIDYAPLKNPHYISLGKTIIAGVRTCDHPSYAPPSQAEEWTTIQAYKGNLFIFGGNDTPNRKKTDTGGICNDTAHGVYIFLEDYLGMRWLMPGNAHRIIPKNTVFDIEDDLCITVASPFYYRQVPYIQNGEPEVKRWMARQRLGGAVTLNCGHSWNSIVPAELFEEHPEWFPMRDGERRVTSRHKIETTNPELVKFIAAQAVQYTEDRNDGTTFSLSPTDMYEFSESPESLAFYEPVPDKHPSVTKLIAKFYRDVSNEVSRRCDKTKLAGFLYSCYLNPPEGDMESFPQNFYPVIAPTPNYGFRLYRSDAREHFENLLQYWSSKTNNLYYYDLPNWFRENSFLVAPPALKIIDFVFEMLVKYQVKGVMIYGMETWSQAALGNYILAKKVCSPFKKAVLIRDEWLDLAYGKEAGRAMRIFYDRLEVIFEEYYNEHPEAIYHASPEVIKDLYARHYSEIQQLLLNAFDCPMDSRQRDRLQMIADNLGGLAWWLKQRELMPDSSELAFEKSDDDIKEMLTQRHDGVKKYPKPPMMFYKD